MSSEGSFGGLVYFISMKLHLRPLDYYAPFWLKRLLSRNAVTILLHLLAFEEVKLILQNLFLSVQTIMENVARFDNIGANIAAFTKLIFIEIQRNEKRAKLVLKINHFRSEKECLCMKNGLA